MHPNPAFRWEDMGAMRAYVADRGFARLFAATPEGPMVAHLPVTLAGTPDAIAFHVARGNRITRYLEGASAMIVVDGPDGYVSPDWYGMGPDEVPTWNYLAVEITGRVVAMPRAAMMEQVDALADANEPRLAPKPAWRRAKADPARIERMADAILGFELRETKWHGTAKLNQNKPEAARFAAAAALEQAGQTAIARAMRNPPVLR